MRSADRMIDLLRHRLSSLSGVAIEGGSAFGARTTYRVGGTCLALITCTSVDSLVQVLDAIGTESFYLLGNGSNTLVSDRGFDGVVLQLLGEFQEVSFFGNTVRLGAGTSLPVAARQIGGHGLTGFEWAVGIPGTVGGAVKMNAGGHGSETARWLDRAMVLRYENGVYSSYSITAGDLGLDYRRSNLGGSDVVLAAEFTFEDGDPGKSKHLMSEVVAWRRENQPGGQNAGSVFINPQGDHAARLIETIGLKGFRHKSAEVSTRHANFIQASPNGSADDVFELIWLVQQRVEGELGIRLRTEIKLIGFDDERTHYLRDG